MNFYRQQQMNALNSSNSKKSTSNSTSNSNSTSYIPKSSTINMPISYRYCGFKTLFGNPIKTKDGKNIIIKRSDSKYLYDLIDDNIENIIKEVNIKIKEGELDGVKDIEGSKESYSVDEDETRKANIPKLSRPIIYLKGPYDAECTGDKYYTDDELNLFILNEGRTIPSDVTLVELSDLKKGKKYLMTIYPTSNDNTSNKNTSYPFFMKLKGADEQINFENAIGIFDEKWNVEDDRGKYFFDQLTPVIFNGTQIIREDLKDLYKGKKIPSNGKPSGYIRDNYRNNTFDYIKCYELPASYNNLFDKTFFEKTTSFFNKKPSGGKKRTSRRTNRRTNRMSK